MLHHDSAGGIIGLCFNNAIETFPGNLLAGMFGFKREMMFEVPSEERATYEKAPEIKF